MQDNTDKSRRKGREATRRAREGQVWTIMQKNVQILDDGTRRVMRQARGREGRGMQVGKEKAHTRKQQETHGKQQSGRDEQCARPLPEPKRTTSCTAAHLSLVRCTMNPKCNTSGRPEVKRICHEAHQANARECKSDDMVTAIKYNGKAFPNNAWRSAARHRI